MTERLSEISARIEGIRQLGTVVNAMRGIAAARAQLARGQLVAVDSYAATIALAIGWTLTLLPPDHATVAHRSARPALILFTAEQGFAGAFSERVLEAVAPDLSQSEIFLIGTRGKSVAAERKIDVAWNSPMPSHSLGIPKLADKISDALYDRIDKGEIDQLDAVFGRRQPGRGIHVERRRMFPVDTSRFHPKREINTPLLNLAPDTLLIQLTADYMHAQLCNAGLHAFAAENEARMETMASAHNQIKQQLSALQATQRILRQREITAEIVELVAGETASRSGYAESGDTKIGRRTSSEPNV